MKNSRKIPKSNFDGVRRESGTACDPCTHFQTSVFNENLHGTILRDIILLWGEIGSLFNGLHNNPPPEEKYT